MGDLWMQFEALDPLAQSAAVGLVVSMVVGALKRLIPSFSAGPSWVKNAVAVVLSAATGYTRGGLIGAVLAVLVALGGYDASKNVTKTFARTLGGQ